MYVLLQTLSQMINSSAKQLPFNTRPTIKYDNVEGNVSYHAMKAHLMNS